MNKYNVITDKKNAGMDTGTMESFTILATNLKEAYKVARRQVRREDDKRFVWKVERIKN